MVNLKKEYFPRHIAEVIDNVTPQGYMNEIADSCRDTLGFLRVVFQRDIAGLLEDVDYAASLVGSDSRFESSGAYTNFEIQLVVDPGSDLTSLQSNFSENAIGFNQIGTMQFHVIRLREDSTVRFLDSAQQDMHPSRPFDASFIHGSSSLFEDYKRSLLEESKEIKFRKLNDRLRGYRRTCKKGLEEQILDYVDSKDGVHFSIPSGIAYFHPESYRKGFKYGPLRLVQEKLVNSVLKYCTRYDDPTALLVNMPFQTPDRLDYFREEGVLSLSQSTVDDLSEAYRFFTHNYHRSELEYLRSDQSFTEFDSSIARDHINNTLSITQESIIVGN